MFTTSNLSTKVVAAASVLLFSWGCLAQEAGGAASPAGQTSAAQTSPNPTDSTSPQQQQPDRKQIIVPAGTTISLVVARALRIKSAREGDAVYLQTAFPVTAGNQMVIPTGTYLQGVIDKVTRRDKTRYVLEFRMHSASLIYNNGYTVAIPGIQDVMPTVARATPLNPQAPGNVPVMAATGTPATPQLPPLPGFGDGPRNAMIGMGVAAGVAVVVVAVAATHGPGPLMHQGTPMEFVLQYPLVLDADQVASAIRQFSAQIQGQPPTVPVQRPPYHRRQQRDSNGWCVSPGDPGTPDTVIPGTPPHDGFPGTPETRIPGRPATPDQHYPCPE